MNKLLRFFNFLSFILLILFFSGCVRLSYYQTIPRKPSLIRIDEFINHYSLKLNFSPFSEEIKLYNKDFTIFLREGNPYVVVNAQLKNLYLEPEFKKGVLFIPSSLPVILKNLRKYPERGKFISWIPIRINRIVVDPGHGGRDPGAISPWGLKEKEVNLSIAFYLKKFLKERGFEVFLTRNSDKFVSLKERVNFSIRKKADLFISIHANSNRARFLKGLEIYYLSPRFSDTQSKILATAENLCKQEALDFSYKIRKIIGEMLNLENRRETLELASAIQLSAENFGIETRDIKGAPFYVLKYNFCPALLIEVGYLTNSQEERKLRSSLYRRQIALSIAEGITQLTRSLNEERARNH